jgi:hypothetical protein
MIVCVLMLFGCEEATLHPKNYPYLVTHGVQANATTAVLNAEVLDTGTSPVLSYGFILEDNKPAHAPDTNPVVDKPFAKGPYSLTIAVTPSTTYRVKAFAQTADNLVVGRELTFETP